MSTTHPHIAAVIRSELLRRSLGPGGRILDVGCGNGDLIGYLSLTLPGAEVHGFDVADSGHVFTGFPTTTIRRLDEAAPGLPWADRIRVGGVGDPWPHDDESLDVVCSNQVVEHVFDLDAFLAETQRVLRPGGFAVHVFPMKRVLWETHTAMPLAHRFADRDTRRTVVRAWSKLGLGRFAQYRERMSFEEYVDLSTDLIQFACFHRSWPELAQAARRNQLSASRRYTSEYYRQKALAVLGRPLADRYRPRPSFVETALAELSTLVASGTMVLEKPRSYQPWEHG